MIYFPWQLLISAREVICDEKYLSEHNRVACYNCFNNFSSEEILNTDKKSYYDTIEYLCPNCEEHLIGGEFPIDSMDFLDAMSAIWYNGISIEHVKRGISDDDPTTDQLLEKFSHRWKIINPEWKEQEED